MKIFISIHFAVVKTRSVLLKMEVHSLCWGCRDIYWVVYYGTKKLEQVWKLRSITVKVLKRCNMCSEGWTLVQEICEDHFWFSRWKKEIGRSQKLANVSCYWVWVHVREKKGKSHILLYNKYTGRIEQCGFIALHQFCAIEHNDVENRTFKSVKSKITIERMQFGWWFVMWPIENSRHMWMQYVKLGQWTVQCQGVQAWA